jgi:hypothetical protein
MCCTNTYDAPPHLGYINIGGDNNIVNTTTPTRTTTTDALASATAISPHGGNATMARVLSYDGQGGYPQKGDNIGVGWASRSGAAR